MSELVMMLSLLLAGPAAPPPQKADIVVMTQNQYLGADLTPVFTATDPGSFNAAAVQALQEIIANNFPLRARRLAGIIAERRPHVVGLQEVVQLACNDFGSGACAPVALAMNDQLAVTLAALEDRHVDYDVAAIVENFVIPGLPISVDGDAVPDVLISFKDRDVILTRGDVNAQAVAFPCAALGMNASVDGCNYQTGLPIPAPFNFLPRGFVGVDALIGGASYRVVTTHLEPRYPVPIPPIQAGQAAELLTAIGVTPSPPGSQLLVIGDMNSDEEDAAYPGPVPTPYQQIVGAGFHDLWDLRPGQPKGLTCCQLPNQPNNKPTFSQRVDHIFSLAEPSKVQAHVMQRRFRLWPSDHYSVVAEVSY